MKVCTLHNEILIYIAPTALCYNEMIRAEHKACKNCRFDQWVDSEMPLIDCCVQEINRHVCDQLLLNAAKHVEIESDVQNANALDN